MLKRRSGGQFERYARKRRPVPLALEPRILIDAAYTETIETLVEHFDSMDGAAPDTTAVRRLAAPCARYADLQNAFASVYASVGLDPYDPGISTDMPVAELAGKLRTLWHERGGMDG